MPVEAQPDIAPVPDTAEFTAELMPSTPNIDAQSMQIIAPAEEPPRHDIETEFPSVPQSPPPPTIGEEEMVAALTTTFDVVFNDVVPSMVFTEKERKLIPPFAESRSEKLANAWAPIACAYLDKYGRYMKFVVPGVVTLGVIKAYSNECKEAINAAKPTDKREG